MKMVYKENDKAIRKELLQAFRGKRSQTQLSRKMGYKFNQVYRWESGERRLSWSELIKLTQECNIDLNGPLKRIRRFDGDIKNSKDVVQHLLHQKNLNKYSTHLGISIHKMRSWVSGKREIYFDFFLILLQDLDILVDFFESIIDSEKTPLLFLEKKKRDYLAEVACTEPMIGPLVLSLELKPYVSLPTHISGFLAKIIGISEEEEKRLLTIAQKAGIIKYKQGKYTKDKITFHAPQGAQESIDNFWFEQAVIAHQKREKDKKNSIYGHAAIAINKEGLKEIEKAYIHFVNQLHTITSRETSNGELIRIINFQLFDPSVINKAPSCD